MIYGGEPERDRAVEARIGGNVYRTGANQASRHGTLDGWVRMVVGHPDHGRPHRDGPTMLPEAAFDWPIYRAALEDEAATDYELEQRDRYSDA